VTDVEPEQSPAGFLNKVDLQTLIDQLHSEGYTVIGPTIDQAAIVYAEIHSVDDLPIGWSDEQGPGHYRAVNNRTDTYFAFTVGPHSWKKYLFPPQTLMSVAERTSSGWRFLSQAEAPVEKYAFLGVRACELAAIQVQDRVFLEGPWRDPVYAARREAALLIAVNCTQAAATCFCTSTGTGPDCRESFDLCLTELADGFVLESGSTRGNLIATKLPLTEATASQIESAAGEQQRAVEQMTREVDFSGVRDLLVQNPEHPHWEDVAKRCLSCTNCTMVCPTCFCSTVEDIPDLSGDRVERRRQWDSCFNPDFSYMNGSIVRDSIRSRYRQWLTHKLGTWHDQFDRSGCVGCGRCITWCPPGIDLRDEIVKLQQHADDADSREPGSEGTL